MLSIIKTSNLIKNEALIKRNISEDLLIASLDVDQTDGKILVTRPFNSDGTIGGDIVIYPPSLQLEINVPVIYNIFLGAGELYYPRDARFDYIRRKIWIADTGNHRLLKINKDNGQLDNIIRNKIYYPHAIAINENDGGIFVKGYYSSSDLNKKILYYFKSNGDEIASFKFYQSIIDSSSSSSSWSSMSSSSSINMSSSSSSSSSETIYPPDLPSPYSIIYDHVRSRIWWVDNTQVYMADCGNKQVQIYDLFDNDFIDTRTIDVEFKTGNVLIVSKDTVGNWWIVQMNRDNNQYLGRTFVAKE